MQLFLNSKRNPNTFGFLSLFLWMCIVNNGSICIFIVTLSKFGLFVTELVIIQVEINGFV
ncbi:hypothetical protein HanIR_Chr06g0266731 [Helianthus annuus]|nr:hypothetical protein HanIR_Chr06g0266731 [Helianthus annuus]